MTSDQTAASRIHLRRSAICLKTRSVLAVADRLVGAVLWVLGAACLCVRRMTQQQGPASGPCHPKQQTMQAALLVLFVSAACCIGARADAAPIPVGTGVQPHPAVCRIIVPQNDGTAYGSGTLVDVNAAHGLVITNWHVVQGAAGEIMVVFPGGFRSAGKVVKQDKDWDLAAIMIWEPKGIKPVRLSQQGPQPGQPLTIAGYGSGTYRAAEGRCTQYVSPGMHFPFEMVELSAAARNGDSGGPILNEQGQLAGVLFGTGRGRTSGSYSGRVGKFLASVVPDIMNANRVRTPSELPQPKSTGEQLVSVPPRAAEPSWSTAEHKPAKPQPATTSSQDLVNDTPFVSAAPASPKGIVSDGTITWQDVAGETLGAQIKTVLAMIGALAVLLNVAKLFGGGK